MISSSCVDESGNRNSRGQESDGVRRAYSLPMDWKIPSDTEISSLINYLENFLREFKAQGEPNDLRSQMEASIMMLLVLQTGRRVEHIANFTAEVIPHDFSEGASLTEGIKRYRGNWMLCLHSIQPNTPLAPTEAYHQAVPYCLLPATRLLSAYLDAHFKLLEISKPTRLLCFPANELAGFTKKIEVVSPSWTVWRLS